MLASPDAVTMWLYQQPPESLIALGVMVGAASAFGLVGFFLLRRRDA